MRGPWTESHTLCSGSVDDRQAAGLVHTPADIPSIPYQSAFNAEEHPHNGYTVTSILLNSKCERR